MLLEHFPNCLASWERIIFPPFDDPLINSNIVFKNNVIHVIIELYHLLLIKVIKFKKRNK